MAPEEEAMVEAVVTRWWCQEALRGLYRQKLLLMVFHRAKDLERSSVEIDWAETQVCEALAEVERDLDEPL
jgi:hypothetical protein